MFDFKNRRHQRRSTWKHTKGRMTSHQLSPNVELLGDRESARVSLKFAEQCMYKLTDYCGGARLNGLQKQYQLRDGGWIHLSTAAGLQKMKIYRAPREEGIQEEEIVPRHLRPVMVTFHAQQSKIFFQDPNGSYNFYIDLLDNNAFAPFQNDISDYSWDGYPQGSAVYENFYRSGLHVNGFAVREIPANEGMIIYFDSGADLHMVLKFQVFDLDVPPSHDTTDFIDFDLFGDINNEKWYGTIRIPSDTGYGYSGAGMYQPGGSYGIGMKRYYKKPFNFYREHIYEPLAYLCSPGNLIVCGDVNGEPLERIQDLKWSWVSVTHDIENALNLWMDPAWTFYMDYNNKNATIMETFSPHWADGGNIHGVPCITQSLKDNFADIDRGSIWYAKYDPVNQLMVHYPSGDTLSSPWGSNLRNSMPVSMFGAPGGGKPGRTSGSFWEAHLTGGTYSRDITKDYLYENVYYHGQTSSPDAPDSAYMFSPSQMELVGAHESISPYHIPIEFVPVFELTSLTIDDCFIWDAGLGFPLLWYGQWVTFKVTGRTWHDTSGTIQELIGYNSRRRNAWSNVAYRFSNVGWWFAADMYGGMSVYDSRFGFVFGDVSWLEDQNT